MATRGLSKQSAINTLTSLRFLAAFSVFIWHSRIFSSELDKYQLGYLGVGFFFVLSGFILTYVYFYSLRRSGRSNLAKFYVARYAKLYPLHIATFIVSLPLVLNLFNFSLNTETFLSLLGLATVNLTLAQSYFSDPNIHFSYNSVSWSISTEMFFYVIFPVLLYLFGGKFYRLRVAHFLVIAAFIWASLVFYLTKIQDSPDPWFNYIFPLMRLPDFIIGILAGAIFLKIQDAEIKLSLKHRRLLFSVLEITSALALLIAIINMPNVHESLKFGAYLMPFWFIIILIFSFQSGFISKLLLFKPFVFLGSISFAFYMSHQLVLRYVGWAGIQHKTIVSLVISLIVSVALYLLLELPAQNALKNGFSKLQDKLTST